MITKNRAVFLLLVLLFCPETRTMSAARQRAAVLGKAAVSTSKAAPRTFSYRPMSQMPSSTFNAVRFNSASGSGRSYNSLAEGTIALDWSNKDYQQRPWQSWASIKAWLFNKPTKSTTDLVNRALGRKSTQELQGLFDKGVINSESRYGESNESMLHMAVEQNAFPEIIGWLIDEKGVDVNAQDKYEYTPLFQAAKYGNLEVMKFLILKGANPNSLAQSISKSRRSLLYLLQEQDQPSEKTLKIIEYLTPLTDQKLQYKVTLKDKLRRAIKSHDIKNVKQVLATHAFNNTTLSEALILVPSYKDNVLSKELAEVLIDAGAHVNYQDVFFKSTLLHAAVGNDNPLLVEFLLAYGANPIVRDFEGKTPLDYVKKYSPKPKNASKIIELLGPAQNKAYKINQDIHDSQ